GRELTPGRGRNRWRNPDSGPGLRLRSSDPRSSRGRLSVARGTGTSDRASQIGGRVMQLGMIGLGRMGSGMTDRLREQGHEIHTYDPNVEARTADSLQQLKE